ncbi:hypothetical protein HanRHA438_Chr15g0712871 [Helianthus annuus]|nr:hypothetical protein HanRHA438_Chr15g0712871 [Helianthus annuus]
MAGILGCKVGDFPFKHLGLQVGANMNLVKNWKPVVEVFNKRLSTWKANTVSFGGKITLIKSVLSSLPTYYFSLYRALAQVIEELERMRRNFLWGTNPDESKINWVAWLNAMTPKDRGGLGIGSLREANLAMLAKWWWRFKGEGDRLWRKVIYSIHHSSRAWSFIPVRLSKAGPWKQIMKGSKDLESYGLKLELLFRGEMGRGNQIAFWKESWMSDDTLEVRFPRAYALEQNKFATVEDRISCVNGVPIIKFCWRRDPINMEEWGEIENLTTNCGRLIRVKVRTHGNGLWRNPECSR